MPVTRPEILLGGMLWSSWTAASVQYSADEAARAFAFTATDAGSSGSLLAQAWNFMPGTEVMVRESGELICHGYIDKMTPSYDERNHKVDVAGRSKSADHIHSSAEHPKGEIRNKNLLQIAKILDKQKVGFSSDVKKLVKIPLFRINPFESVFHTLDRLAIKHKLVLMGQADGSVKITQGGSKRVNGPLIEGVNIKGASATFDDSDRHSEVKVKGQKAYGSNAAALRINEVAKDSGVKRHKPKHLPTEGDDDKSTAKKRAENHRDRKKGESISVSVKVQGWRDQNGKLYEPNTIIYIYSPLLKLDMDLLVKNVHCSMDSSGSFTQLTLVQPQALGSDAKQGSKTTKQYAWGSDNG